MRIAFDVKGTIEGPKKTFVLALLELLQKNGHEVVVWSNSYGFAVDAVKDNGLSCKASPKRTSWDEDGKVENFFDLAIDDDNQQTWLASKRFIWVHDLPDFMSGILAIAETIHREAWTDIKCQTSEHFKRLQK